MKKHINWKEKLKRFLEEEGALEEYLKFVKDYWSMPFETMGFRSPRSFIIETFNWQLDSYPYWKSIHERWTEYYDYWKDKV